MGTVMSSPKEPGYCNWSQQLRTSKSTFSLKTDRAAAVTGTGQQRHHQQQQQQHQSTSIFRGGLPSSISFRNLNLGQASFGRRSKDKSTSKQQHQHQLQQQQQNHQQENQHQHQHQHQQPSIATISNWSNDGAAASLHQQQQQQLPPAPWKSHVTKSGLTKSTSCYAIKGSSGQRPQAAGIGGPEEKENRDAATAAAGGAGAVDGVSSSRRLLVQASTSDLLKCVAAYLRQECPSLNCDPGSVVAWIRSVDRSLILQGWADMAFVNPPNLVFFYLLVKAAVANGGSDIGSERQLQATLLTCLYVAYSYMGNEISYPLKPFLVDGNRAAFWDRCLSLAGARSGDMLRLNSDPTFFIDVFTELKSYA